MTNILRQPLEIKHDQIDPVILDVIGKIDQIAHQHETKYFLAGATAREVILRHVFGRPSGRRSLDVDFAIAVRDWEHFNALKSLIKRGDFKPHPNKIHRLISNSTPAVLVDLIPFGGVEDADRTIAWPPDEDIVMKVIGFSDGLESAIPVRLDENLVIPVVSLPVLLILKLFAWVDRKHEKRDAVDIYTLMREYGDAGNEDRLYGESLNLLEAEGYDFEFAGARLLGSDAARVISQDTRNRARAILESDSQMKELTNEIIGSSGRSDSEHFRRCELLVGKLRDGFLERV